jgi:hypothetical protein
MTGTAAYVLLKNKIDSASGGGGTVEYKAIKQLDTLPPTETNGTIVQYIGETNSDLTYGYFYRYNGTDWVNCLVQPMPPAPDGSAKYPFLNQDMLRLLLQKILCMVLPLFILQMVLMV